MGTGCFHPVDIVFDGVVLKIVLKNDMILILFSIFAKMHNVPNEMHDEQGKVT